MRAAPHGRRAPGPRDRQLRHRVRCDFTGFLATGGTSGPLFGMWFRDISRCASPAGANASKLASGVAAGLATIQKLGGANVGDNTTIDSLSPASDALTAAAAAGESVGEALIAAAAAARAGAESTADLVASRGRASYVGELARGVLDPGAVTIALFFQTAAATCGTTAAHEPLAWLSSASQ
ncbi:DAK2 domain-containing protein [Pseudarthrobacter sp. Y6]|uniref:DAK2 domain-containing protein n=1 Tax=Pseudarthrobacter sp. Y6 TaxID=3418422 RepID=UPI003CECD83C